MLACSACRYRYLLSLNSYPAEGGRAKAEAGVCWAMEPVGTVSAKSKLCTYLYPAEGGRAEAEAGVCWAMEPVGTVSAKY